MLVGNGLNVPSEVWEDVFKHCVRVYKDGIFGPVFAPQSRIQLILLVCREWHDIAEKMLYTSISLGSDRVVCNRNGKKKVIYGTDVCKRLCTTLRNNPRLVSLVRELRLGGFLCNDRETKNYIRLLGICKNIESLDIRGCARGFADELKAALAKLDLISLKLSAHSLADMYTGERLLVAPELLSLIQKYPRIETADAFLLSEEWRILMPQRAAMLPQPTMTNAKCLSLRELSINNTHLNSSDIRRLAELAPQVEKLKIMAGPECNSALQLSLQTWSSTLKTLDVSISDKILYLNVNWRSAIPIVSPTLVELCELRISSPSAPPSALACLPKLEKLAYTGEYPDGLELAQVIQGGKIPGLRELEAVFIRSLVMVNSVGDSSEEQSAKVAEEIAQACTLRHVRMRTSPVSKLEEPGSPGSVDNDWPEEDGWDGEDEEGPMESSSSESEAGDEDFQCPHHDGHP